MLSTLQAGANEANALDEAANLKVVLKAADVLLLAGTCWLLAALCCGT
jgi:hypothetical protein